MKDFSHILRSTASSERGIPRVAVTYRNVCQAQTSGWRRRRRVATAVASAVFIAAGAAHAQLETEFTPQPKPPNQWTILGGAFFDRGGMLAPQSPTPFTVDFFSVAFPPPGPRADVPEQSVAFFGGAQCENARTRFARLSECVDGHGPEREPVIYKLRNDELGDHFERMPNVGGGEGFVGAVTWIDSDRALAVGGTGKFPRRERSHPALHYDATNDSDRQYLHDDMDYGAGTARAWLYENGAWIEITDLPEEMSALTAADCSRQEPGVCAVGGLQQLWWWRPPAPGEKPEFTLSADVQEIPDFHFRVRQLRFTDTNPSTPMAVTSGCCLPLGAAPVGARLLTNQANSDTWTAEPLLPATDDATAPTGSALVADSYYGFVASAGGVSAVVSPGGAAQALEAGSRIAYTAGTLFLRTLSNLEPELDPADRKLDSVRLVAADGDYAATPMPGTAVSGIRPSKNDGMFDWAVGSLKGAEETQGVAYTTVPELAPLPSPLMCPALADTTCRPAPANILNPDLESNRLVGMGTYGLNAVAFDRQSDGGIAWAAGDRGALARLGGGGRLGAENEPAAPPLRRVDGVPLSNRTPFDSFRPALLGSSGAVPPLAARPVEALAEPELVPYGAADVTRSALLPREPVFSMVMSRDGSEGWAVGAGPGYTPLASGFALQYFDGERWLRCDPTRLGGAQSPNPRCAGLQSLADRKDANGRAAPPALLTIARIPLERDGNPSNDDEFAAIAVGVASGNGKMPVLMYRDGAWAIDEAASDDLESSPGGPETSIAFKRPDDGWLTTRTETGLEKLYHYTGGNWPNGEWKDCGSPTSPKIDNCGVGIGAVPFGALGDELEVQIAGDTVFIGGNRRLDGNRSYPFVASRRGDDEWDLEYDPCRGDPACPDGSADEEGVVKSFSVVDLGNGRIAGWLLGRFGRNPDSGAERPDPLRPDVQPLIRRAPGSREWVVRDVEDTAHDYIPSWWPPSWVPTVARAPKVLSYADAGEERTFIMPSFMWGGRQPHYPPLVYDPDRDRWEVLPAPFVSNTKNSTEQSITRGVVTAAAPDANGGFWLAARQGFSAAPPGDDRREVDPGTYYYHYTGKRHRPVFEDAPNPIDVEITGLDGTPDGTVWVSTRSDRLYRYDRLVGWERVRIKGWDPGAIVTNPSSAFAVAVNDAGVGVVVGERGRIANLSPDGVRLDPASGRRCSDGPSPCGTPRDLVAADVAPDGSALVGGEHLTLVWRPAGGSFALAAAPPTSVDSQITSISMPDPASAWLTTEVGDIWGGTLVGTEWRWRLEAHRSEAADESRRVQLNAIAVDESGLGLAVGDRGAMLERQRDGSWRRIDSGHLDDLYSIALPRSGYGEGTLVGGNIGLILTNVGGGFHVARRSDVFDPGTAGLGSLWAARVVGLAVAPGDSDGEVEGWAATQLEREWARRGPPPYTLLHYTSSEDPLLNPASRARPLPDTPAPEPGELTFAAFGRSECHQREACPELMGSNLFNDIVSRKIRDELVARREAGGSRFAAVFTGDINRRPGLDNECELNTGGLTCVPNTPRDRNIVQKSWREFIAKPLLEGGVPVFGVPGKTDISRVKWCVVAGSCADSQEHADAGVSLQWRKTFADMPAPWGQGDPFSSGDGVSFEPVEPVRRQARSVEAPEEVGGAHTHYAVDVKQDGEAVARLVFLDNSFARSLSAGEGSQNPVEVQGGQAGWLERMLCEVGTPSVIGRCTREPGQAAVVVTNAPTYSYGPGGLDAVQADGSVLEALLLRHKATAVISGRLGWNGLFYTLGAGVHVPCPGGEHPQGPPSTAEAGCSDAERGEELPPVPAGKEIAESLRGLGAPVPAQADEALGAADGLTAAIPTLIAASAGGRFGPDGAGGGEASDGFWHGYSVMRIRESGEVVVEQRPIFDWIGIEAQEHTLRPGQKMTLRGFGREPLGTDTSVRINRIDSPAITHRYDLVLADEEKPWLPAEDPEGEYIPLDPAVATVDQQTGVVRAGKGRQQRTYSIAILSVGDKAASWPLVFEPAKSFQPKPAEVATVRPPTQLPAPVQQPLPIHVLSQPPTPPPASPPPPAQLPIIGDLSLPAPPQVPPVGATPTAAPTPAPPPPPVPPPPPSSGTGLPLSLNAPISPISIVPTVIPPTPPPINPAPPGGSAARKEAKQRQAATAKSEEGGTPETAANPEDAQPRTNAGDSPNTATRLDQGRYAFTAVSNAEQASAWSRGALYGGGAGLMALVLAMSWIGTRPGSRRREPRLPAPAWARNERRNR